MRGLFITGTGTEVGKTFVAVEIARQLLNEGQRVGVYKPVASGCRPLGDQLLSDDAEALWHAAGRPLTLDAVCPQRFKMAAAPNVAARAEGQSVNEMLLKQGLDVWQGQCDIVLVEGAGGLMSPLADDYFNADLAIDLGFPVVIVAANRLGVINDTLQTAITASVFREGLDVAGVVLNDVSDSDNSDTGNDASRATNRQELERLLIPPLLAECPFGGPLPKTDWWQLAKIAKSAEPSNLPASEDR